MRYRECLTRPQNPRSTVLHDPQSTIHNLRSSTIHNLRSTIHDLLLFLFILTLQNPLSAASDEVSISILSLLKPTSLSITILSEGTSLLDAGEGRTFPLLKGKRIEVTQREQKLILKSQKLAASQVSIACPGACLFTIDIPGRIVRTYRGDLLLTSGNSAISVVLHLTEEELVASITASEMGEFREKEALKAFSVLARSFLQPRRRHPEIGADFCDTTHCQVFQGFAATAQIRTAVNSTEGLILTYRQTPFRPFYSRVCGGQTATFREVWGDEETPPYPFFSVDCVCATKVTAWHYELSVASEPQPPATADTRKLEDFRIRFGRQFGWNLIRGNQFSVQADGNNLLLTGTRIGHGVGLCQLGSSLMASHGAAFTEILQHYFPATELRKE